MSFRRSPDEVRALAVKLGLLLAEPLPAYAPRYRIGPRQTALLFRPGAAAGAVRLQPATWGLVPPSGQEPRYLLTNARAETLTNAWPWKLVYRSGRCIVLADGFFEPAKPARSKDKAPWHYYTPPDGGPLLMAGLLSELADPETGALTVTCTVVTTRASADIHIHDRMPVLLQSAAVHSWLWDATVPDPVLGPAPAGSLRHWQVADDAKNSRRSDHPGMIEPVT